MVILPGSMFMCQWQELRRRFADSRPTLIAPSTSTSRLSASSPATQSFTLLYRRFSTYTNFTARRPFETGGIETGPLAALVLLILMTVASEGSLLANPSTPYGLSSRPAAQAYLGMPKTDQQAPP